MSTTTNPRRGDAVMPPLPGTTQLPQEIHTPTVCIPEKVAAAREDNIRVRGLYTDASDRVSLARQNVTRSKTQDMVDDAARVVAGKPRLAEKDRALPKAEAELGEAERERQVMANAAAQTAATLRSTVIAHRDEWLASLEPVREVASTKVLEALAALEKAAGRYAVVNGAYEWVASVTGREVPMGVSSGRFYARIGNSHLSVSEVTAALRAVVMPAEKEPTIEELLALGAG